MNCFSVCLFFFFLGLTLNLVKYDVVAFSSVSMMLLDGHQRNIIQMTNNLLGAMSSMGKCLSKKMDLLHNLALCGMKHLDITMMLLQGSTMMEIQVWF